MMLKRNNWERWEASILEVFAMALLELAKEPSLPVTEVELNRLLALKVRSSRRKWERENEYEIKGMPFFNSPNQPDELAPFKHTSENKIPEFQWGVTDSLSDMDKFYTVECKRLGDPENHYGNYYYEHGILRFINDSWRYGYDCESGLMIGYLQHLDFEAWRTRINSLISTKDIGKLQPTYKNTGIYSLRHSLDRAFRISPFKLDHFWIDLKKFGKSEKTTARKKSTAKTIN